MHSTGCTHVCTKEAHAPLQLFPPDEWGGPVGRLTSRLSRRGARVAAALSVAAGLALSMGLVVQSSYASFNSQSSIPSFSVSTATVALTNDAAGSAAISLSNQKPGGPTYTKCINVISGSSVASAVNFYSSVTGDSALRAYINLSVTAGTAGSTCSSFTAGKALFSGTLQGLSAYQNFGNGLRTGWNPTGGISETLPFQFTVGLSSAAPSSTQGKSVSATFTWEAQNT